ncbi:retrotransposon protein, putative, ty1-copia subclass [Tanacetum coccineum]
MTDLGALNYFLGISTNRTPIGLLLSQKKYDLQLLERAYMPCRGAPVSYFTRPNLSYAVQHIFLYMHDPREPHLAALKCILRYVQGTLDLGLHLYASFTTSLVGYTDADWAGCPSTRSVEAEYRGVANVVVETAWLRNLLRELHSPLSTATLVYCDNVRVLHVPSHFQYADIFIKGLPSALFEEFLSSLSVRPPPAPIGETLSLRYRWDEPCLLKHFCLVTSEISKSHNVLRIALVVIIDRQLPFEYTIDSRSTDVMVPIPPAPVSGSTNQAFDDWNKIYDVHNDVVCLMLGSMTSKPQRKYENFLPYDMLQELKSMFGKQAGVKRFDLMQTFHACKQEEGKYVSSHVLKMKGYVEQLESLGYVLPQEISVGLILNGLTSDFAGFVMKYNRHNMEKTIGKLHALLIEYEKGLPKKAATPQVLAIQGGRIQKPNKKPQGAKGKVKGKGKGNNKLVYEPKPKNPKPTAKEHPTKDEACHHCKELTPPYTPQHNGVFERRNHTLFDIVQSMMNLTTLSLSFLDYALESATRFPNMVPTKKVDKTPYELWYAEFLEKNLISQGASGRKAAFLDPESNKWFDAMNAEMQSMKYNQVWRLVDLPPYAKGYIQTYEIDYEETFSLIEDIRAIRILISITVFYDYEIWKMDVKTAFLNGYLDEDIYMVQPKGFIDPKHPRKVCKLQRSIYELKQTSRSWNKRFDEEIKKFGFAQNLDEP